MGMCSVGQLLRWYLKWCGSGNRNVWRDAGGGVAVSSPGQRALRPPVWRRRMKIVDKTIICGKARQHQRSDKRSTAANKQRADGSDTVAGAGGQCNAVVGPRRDPESLTATDLASRRRC